MSFPTDIHTMSRGVVSPQVFSSRSTMVSTGYIEIHPCQGLLRDLWSDLMSMDDTIFRLFNKPSICTVWIQIMMDTWASSLRRSSFRVRTSLCCQSSWSRAIIAEHIHFGLSCNSNETHFSSSSRVLIIEVGGSSRAGRGRRTAGSSETTEED